MAGHIVRPAPGRTPIFSSQADMNATQIQQLIEAGLPGARAQVQGEDGVHFEAIVVADAFRGKLPLARHRMVYATLGERMGGEIHALSLRTLTPDEAGPSA
jgi:acid stress-induced BolA-like protein IbaG/YrbA